MTVKSAHHFLNSTYANLPRHLAARASRCSTSTPTTLRRAASPTATSSGAQRARRGAGAGPDRRGRRARGRRAALGLVGLAQPGWHHGQRLTTEELTDRGGGGAFHSARVEVEPLLAPSGAGANLATHPAEVP